MQYSLAQLRDIFGDGLLEILDNFLLETPIKLDLMLAASLEGDFDTVLYENEGLADLSRQLSAYDLADSCQRIKEAIKAGEVDSVFKRVEQAIREFQTVKTGLEQEKQSLFYV